MNLVVPSGFPIWLRASDVTTYGGNVEKRNHYGQGVIDALTDVGAEEFSRLAADLAAVGRVVDAWTIEHQCIDTVAGAPTILSVYSMFGNRTIPYVGSSPPSGFPTVTRNGPGDVTFTFASSYLDPYGVSGAFAIKHPAAALVSASGGSANPDPTFTDTAVRVRAFNAAGSALADARVVLTVGSG